MCCFAVRVGSTFWWNRLFSADGAVECVDQYLNLDEFVAGALTLVPVKRSGQHLRMRVTVLDHGFACFLQRFKPLAISSPLFA
jgi:hypothetical protein